MDRYPSFSIVIEVMHSVTYSHTRGYIMLQYMVGIKLLAYFKYELHFQKRKIDLRKSNHGDVYLINIVPF